MDPIYDIQYSTFSNYSLVENSNNKITHFKYTIGHSAQKAAPALSICKLEIISTFDKMRILCFALCNPSCLIPNDVLISSKCQLSQPQMSCQLPQSHPTFDFGILSVSFEMQFTL